MIHGTGWEELRLGAAHVSPLSVCLGPRIRAAAIPNQEIGDPLFSTDSRYQQILDFISSRMRIVLESGTCLTDSGCWVLPSHVKQTGAPPDSEGFPCLDRDAYLDTGRSGAVHDFGRFLVSPRAYDYCCGAQLLTSDVLIVLGVFAGFLLWR